MCGTLVVEVQEVQGSGCAARRGSGFGAGYKPMTLHTRRSIRTDTPRDASRVSRETCAPLGDKARAREIERERERE